MLFALEFPPVSHLLVWPEIIFGLNKVGLIHVVATLITLTLVFLAVRKSELVPKGVQNVMESAVEFIENSVIAQTIGPDGLRYLPFLFTIFFFVLFSNIFEVIPGIQFPGNARMAMPIFLALVVWCVFNFIGLKHQGPRYFLNVMFPPGVPGALKPLVALIELVSTFLVRPFSLAVRLFANMLAGHLLLVTFGVLAAALWSKSVMLVIMPLPFVVLIGLTAFEVLVAFLQAFIFTILTAVYIGGALHHEH
ncbi:MAG: F0F1 ATP synthase subunit A [Acidimicrobiales bacterium]